WGYPSPWRASQKALLHQKGLVDFLERARILADRRRDGLHTDGPTFEHLDDGIENARIHVVESELVDLEPLPRLDGDGGGARAASAAFARGGHRRSARRREIPPSPDIGIPRAPAAAGGLRR